MLPTFCRVTGNSRNLPKPNYFPLLPPISPVEASRICRLMGRSVPPEQHVYVPVIEYARPSNRTNGCHITGLAPSDQHHYQPAAPSSAGPWNKHRIDEQRNYVHVPEPSAKPLKRLLERMSSRPDAPLPDHRFVYELEQNAAGLVVTAEMEAAIRRGEIESLSVSKDATSLLIRLKDGPSLTLELRPGTDEAARASASDALFQGTGPDRDTLVRQLQIKQYKKRKISAGLSPTLSPEPQVAVVDVDWDARIDRLTAANRSACNLLTVGADWRRLVYPDPETWDWEALNSLPPVDVPPPLPVHRIEPLDVPADRMAPGFVQSSQVPVLNEESTGFDAVPLYDAEKLDPLGYDHLQNLPADYVRAVNAVETADTPPGFKPVTKLKQLFNDVDSLLYVPFVHEVAALASGLASPSSAEQLVGYVVRTELDGVKFVGQLDERVPKDALVLAGALVSLEQEKRFVVGRQTAVGFVPGKVVAGRFEPGFVVQNAEGASFLPGCIVDGRFAAGQLIRDPTTQRDSTRFVTGQVVQTLLGPKFVPGRTVLTRSGLKFAAGQTDTETGAFHSGQIMQTERGAVFVPGVTFDTPQGARFVAGQRDETTDEFVAGQAVRIGERPAFVPGETLETSDGPVFLPGQSYVNDRGRIRFCPGRVVNASGGEPTFVPGETMPPTADGVQQFVSGLLAEERFVPCGLEDGRCVPAASEERVFSMSGTWSDGLPIDGGTFSALPRKKPDVGYMVQHEERIKFLPTEQSEDELLSGVGVDHSAAGIKIVPGQLLELGDTPKFVPGKKIESAVGSIFIPGQAVRTGPNRVEQFVPGQVIDGGSRAESAEGDAAGAKGPTFCPGQMVNCESGKKFVPGQVFSGKNGPRFVPGKILMSPSGASTFIPGQVVYSCDRGSVFVPGNVVDTSDGPYFVPGRVLEQPSGAVRFVAGEIVETESGPRYVTPHETDIDLLDEALGAEEVVVQGFAVSPEELRLITAYPFAALHYPRREPEGAVINSRMLRQMAAAGIAVSRLTNTNLAADPSLQSTLNDVIINAPRELDNDAILGADVNRRSEPAVVVAKPKKEKNKERSPLARMYAALEEQYAASEGEALSFSTRSSTTTTTSSQRYVTSHLELGGDEETAELLDNTAAKHKMSVRPQRRKRSVSRQRTDSTGEVQETGVVESSVVNEPKKSKHDDTRRSRSARQTAADPSTKREAVVRELVETEEEFVTDMEHVVNVYYRQMDHPSTPRRVSDQRDALFGPFKQIQEFHKSVLLEGLKYYANDPRRLGKTFLRLERDFDKHAQYYGAEPKSQELLKEDKDLREFFEEYSQRIGDAKRLSEYLKLPIQRINDFQVLIQDLISHSRELREDTSDLEKAHEFMLELPQKLSDTAFLENISGYRGSIHKLGRLLRHDWWTVTDSRGRSRERYLFLFKARILVTKVKRVTDDRNLFLLKDIIRIPDVEVREHDQEEPASFDLIHSDPRFVRYPLNLRSSAGRKVFQDWVFEIQKYSSHLIALQEHLNDDLQVDGPGETDNEADDVPPPKPQPEVKPEIKPGVSKLEPKPEIKEEAKPEVELEVKPEVKPEPAKTESSTGEEDSAQIAKKIKGLLGLRGKKPEEQGASDSKPEEHASQPSAQRETVDPAVKKETVRPEPPSTVFEIKTPVSQGDQKSEPILCAPMADGTTEAPAAAGADAVAGPKFIRTIRGVFCEPGEKATFDCSIDGSPHCNVTWLRNNRPLDDRFADRVQMSESGKTHKLVIMNCRPEDSGQYTARAANSEGAVSCSAPLVVETLTPEQREQMAKDNSPMFMVKLHDTELIEGSSVHFIIKVRGEPVPTVNFKKNGKTITNSDRIKILNEQAATGFFELLINGVAKEDEGEYSCYALNRFGETSCSANITVTNDKDLFELLGAQGLLAPGDKPEFKWFKDGAPYDPEERFKVDFKEEEDTLALVFQGVKPEDAGLYTCVAATSTGKISCSAELTVQGAIHHLLKEPEAPTFSASLGDTEVGAGGSAMLELKYKGFPKPRMVWSKGDEIVKAGGRFRFLYEDEESVALIIKNVDAADAGVYKVTATNDLGEATTEGRLLVKAPPKFKKKVQDMACMTEEQFKMTVEVEGSPAPDVKWYKDGNLVIESERIKIVKESQDVYALVIEKVIIEDSGAYSVVASNAIGQMSEFWHLVTNAKPSFVKGMLKDKDVEENGSINLQVQVFGNPLPSVKWVKDGKDLVHDGQNIVIKQEGGNHTLTVNNVKRSDSGKYDCVITNPFGVQQETSDVHIRCKPEFVEGLKDLEARVGTKDVTFTAKASAYPAPKVKWFLDEVEITEERTEYVKQSDHVTGTYSLTASQVMPDMSGKYTLQLENDLGPAKSSAILTLQCAPKIEQSIENAVVDEGKSAMFTFKCLALPEASVKWFKDGKEVSADARVKISSPSSGAYCLSIDDCVKEDAGNYTAKVANDLGEKELSASLTIQYKPKILEDNLQLIDIYEEEAIYYKVTFEGVPKPKAEWTLNGVVMERTERCVLTETESSYSLRIEEAALSDAGQFKVKLSNVLGEEVKSAPVTVHPLSELHVPKVIKALQDTEVCKGNQLTLQAKVSGIPQPTVEWFKDGEPLKHNKDYVISEDELTHEYYLVLPVAKEVHGGKYTLKATNPNGADETHAELTILIRPELTHPPDVVVNYFEDTTIEVKVVAIPAHEAKWLKNGVELNVSDRVSITKEESVGVHRLTLHKCDSSDEAVYTLVANNSQGETRGDVKLHVKSEAPAFSEELQSKHVRAGKVARLDGTVTGIPMPSVEWTKNGKPVPESERIEYVAVAKDGEFSLIINNVELADFAEYEVKATSVIGEARSVATLTESQIAPTLSDKLPVTTRGHEGEPLKISVLVDGSPRPDVVWYKDDVELVPDERTKIETLPDGTAVLFIDPADPRLDNGQYKMVALNASGKASTHTEVDVKRKPRPAKIDTPLDHHIQAVENRPLKLEAKVSGYPRPEVKWTKDGKHIRPGSHHTTITVLPCGTVSLEIDKCTAQEAGQYCLQVSNDQGEDSCEAAIEILPPPTAPRFSTPLFPVKATEGFNARLEAKVQGNPPPELTWYKDGHKIHGDYAKKPESGGRVKLDLRNVSRETDPGEYSVTAKNEEGEADTKARLEVRPRKSDGPESAPHILTPPHDTSVDEGSAIRLWALVSGNPVADVEWTRNGKPVDADRSFVWMDGDKVFIEIDKAVKKQDEGEYELVLTNPTGKASAKCKVTVWKVFTPPSFTQRFSDLQQLPAYDAKFLAKIAGQPKPAVTWTFEDKPIAPDSDKYKMKRDGELCVLFVRDCSPGRAGKYACIAKNSEGEDRCEAVLEVVERIEKREKEEAPTFLKKIGDCEVYEGMTAKFTACAAGFPEPECEWFRNGVRLHPSERVKMEREGSGLLRLSIKYVDEVDVGQYSLRIFNKVGEATCSGELIYDTLDSKPKKPVGESYVDFDKFRSTKAPVPLADKPVINLMNDRYLTVSWKPSLPIGPRCPVTYAVEIKELPDGDWKKIRSGIRGCCCDVRNLDPYLDYSFRIRVENEYGVSEPSPHSSTSRDRLNLVPVPRKRFLEPGETFNPDQSCYFPKDYDLDRPPHEGYTHAPRFLRQETEKQYGVKNQSASLFWYVYGYPKPHIKFYFNDEPVETGGRFDFSYTRNGQLSLFVNKMLDRDAGHYEAVASNPYGEARQRIKLEVAEHPYFIERPQESVFLTRKSGRVVVRIGGYPECQVKWYKDWSPLAPSSRVKLQHILPDTYVMSISDVIGKDEGLYSVVARNPAGAVSASAMVHVEELEEDYAVRTYQRNKNVKAKSVEVDRLFGNYYDIGDELGRGTQGVTYHAVERASGKSYAAKIMTGSSDEIRKRMMAEMEAMNTLHHERLIRLFDAYETPDNMTLVQELAAGGDLVDSLTKRPFITESDIAHYVRQLLHGLRHMHEQNWAHLGLTPGDLLLSHPESDDLKIGDFGLARKIINTKLTPLDHGMPEFVAPETANGQGVGLPADMWSVGVMTYLFLSGISPFRGDTDRDTLRRVQAGQINFDPDAFSNISADAKDFIARLLVFHAEGRLTVDEALKHPWLREADRLGREGLYEISTERLKTYYDRHYRDWYGNASCRNWYRRRPLSSAFTHPSCMVYPPGEEYTPRSTPAPRERSASVKPEFKSLELPGVDTGLGSSESHYQYGPDTYLLQLRDVDFPVRLRHYMKVASGRSPSFAMHMQTSNPDFTVPVIHERRRFTDIMDEEIDDESRKARRHFNQQHGDAGPLQYYTPNRRLKNELGVRDEAHIEADSILEAKRRGLAPFFREKPKTVAMVDGEAAQLTCLVMGQPAPSVQWFRNDILIVPDRRVTITQKDNGLSILKLSPAYVMDCGIYKAVSRNKIGQTTAKCRLVIGDVPAAPESPEAPEISDSEILLRWKVPRHDGNATVLCYSLQQKKALESDWTQVAESIDHEFFLVRNLEPDTQYQFRLAARNRFGWSEKSIPTDAISTKDPGSAKVSVTRAMKYLQQLTEARTEPIVAETHEEEAGRVVDYSMETEPKEIKTSAPTDDFSFIAEINRGRFTLIAKCSDKETNKMYAAKIVKRDYDTLAELKVAQTLCHERIASVHQAYDTGSLLVTVMEKLQGIDVLSALSQRHEYTENVIAHIVSQVLDGLQYLHWRGLTHLDLQPDNVLLTSARSLDVKLCDFGCAQRVSKQGTVVEQDRSYLPFTAPEILNGEPAFPQSDIWSLGCLTYVLLSGVSPFAGENDDEIRQNITYVRYRFEPLYKEISMEAQRFIMFVFKRAPFKRPTTEECLEHRWFQPSEHMFKKRERAVFLGNRLKDFSDEYHTQRMQTSTKCDDLLSSFGLGLGRSLSNQTDIFTTY